MGKPFSERRASSVPCSESLRSPPLRRVSRTLILKLLPTRSPMVMPLLAMYPSSIRTCERRRAMTSSTGASKDISWAVTALLSLVPANPMRLRETPRALDMCRTRRLVSQLVAVTRATHTFPSGLAGGYLETSSTTKSSGSALSFPPLPAVSE
ncbi:MAG: hypothetical protein A4E29_01185 [Methanomassiliicoccales archaeon PtaB.Bin134]|nr:MAG: hypothetical protein A4E29_01185 [Methanomassiliicoccales archaeon PtaB.Bin134]